MVERDILKNEEVTREEMGREEFLKRTCLLLYDSGSTTSEYGPIRPFSGTKCQNQSNVNDQSISPNVPECKLQIACEKPR